MSTHSPIHDTEELFAHILCPFEGSGLHEVIIAPGRRELVVLPGVVHREQGQVVALGLVELGLPLVCQLRLLLDERNRKTKLLCLFQEDLKPSNGF